MAYCPELEIPAENAGEINIKYPGVTSLENLPKNSLSPGGLGGEKHRKTKCTNDPPKWRPNQWNRSKEQIDPGSQK